MRKAPPRRLNVRTGEPSLSISRIGGQVPVVIVFALTGLEIGLGCLQAVW